MASFNDLATELQLAIWQLVLPYRGMHWVEIEGRPHEAPYVRDSIRIMRSYDVGGETRDGDDDDTWDHKLASAAAEPLSVEHRARYHRKSRARDHTGAFFCALFPVVPAVWGSKAGAREDVTAGEDGALAAAEEEEVDDTRRCRQLSTYTQVTALLATSRLARGAALEYVRANDAYAWYVYRSLGAARYRSRGLSAWAAEYTSDDGDGGIGGGGGGDSEGESAGYEYEEHCKLVPQIHGPLDLVVLRLHDRHGRAKPMLRRAAWELRPEAHSYQFTLAWFDRVAIEWHPRWAADGGDDAATTTPSAGDNDDDSSRSAAPQQEEDMFCARGVRAVMDTMSSRAGESTLLYWLVDGVARPDWARDYPAAVPAVFQYWMARWRGHVHRFQANFDAATRARVLADCGLEDLAFEANGRRYYVVFVAIPWEDYGDELRPRVAALDPGLGVDGPFLGGEGLWPEALRAPARFAHDMLVRRDLGSLCTYSRMSFVLSWEAV